MLYQQRKDDIQKEKQKEKQKKKISSESDDHRVQVHTITFWFKIRNINGTNLNNCQIIL